MLQWAESSRHYNDSGVRIITSRHEGIQPHKGLPCTRRRCHRPHRSPCAFAAWGRPPWRHCPAPEEARKVPEVRWEPPPEWQRPAPQHCPRAGAERLTSHSASLRDADSRCDGKIPGTKQSQLKVIHDQQCIVEGHQPRNR